jgi:hypothetical protein
MSKICPWAFMEQPSCHSAQDFGGNQVHHRGDGIDTHLPRTTWWTREGMCRIEQDFFSSVHFHGFVKHADWTTFLKDIVPAWTAAWKSSRAQPATHSFSVSCKISNRQSYHTTVPCGLPNPKHQHHLSYQDYTWSPQSVQSQNTSPPLSLASTPTSQPLVAHHYKPRHLAEMPSKTAHADQDFQLIPYWHPTPLPSAATRMLSPAEQLLEMQNYWHKQLFVASDRAHLANRRGVH